MWTTKVICRAAAERFGTEHHEIRPIPDFRTSFEAVIRNMGEPFAIASAVPAFYVFQKLREFATVVLTGDGGDEAFAGYTHFQHLRRLARIRRFLPEVLSGSAYTLFDAAYGQLPACRALLKTAMAGLQYFAGRGTYDPPWEQRQVLQPAVYQCWHRSRAAQDWSKGLEKLFAETDPLRQGMLVGQFGNMCDHILAKVDITSMAHGVKYAARCWIIGSRNLARESSGRVPHQGPPGQMDLARLRSQGHCRRRCCRSRKQVRPAAAGTVRQGAAALPGRGADGPAPGL